MSSSKKKAYTPSPTKWKLATNYDFSPAPALTFEEKMQFIDHFGKRTPNKSIYLPKITHKAGLISSPPWERVGPTNVQYDAAARMRKHNAKLNKSMYNTTSGLGPPVRVKNILKPSGQVFTGILGSPMGPSPRRKAKPKKKPTTRFV